MNTMAVKPGDHDLVKTCFGLTVFNAEAWLQSLSKETVKLYCQFCNTHKHRDAVLRKTVDNIAEMKKLQAMKLKRTQVFQFCFHVFGGCAQVGHLGNTTCFGHFGPPSALSRHFKCPTCALEVPMWNTSTLPRSF